MERYAGKWHEISRFPNRFQRADGKIGVLNECRTRESRVKAARATARRAERHGPYSKLKVTFFCYWIIGLDPDYRWAVVGDPGRKYLWILSREPRTVAGEYARALEAAPAQGYDTDRLIKTEQTPAYSTRTRLTSSSTFSAMISSTAARNGAGCP